MFYEIFDRLCRENHTSPFSVCIKLGFSRSTPSYWKRSGGIPKRDALEKIAAYFNVPVDYLLGRTEEKETASAAIDRSTLFSVFANLTESEMNEVLRYAEFVMSKRQGKEEPKQQ